MWFCWKIDFFLEKCEKWRARKGREITQNDVALVCTLRAALHVIMSSCHVHMDVWRAHAHCACAPGARAHVRCRRRHRAIEQHVTDTSQAGSSVNGKLLAMFARWRGAAARAARCVGCASAAIITCSHGVGCRSLKVGLSPTIFAIRMTLPASPKIEHKMSRSC